VIGGKRTGTQLESRRKRGVGGRGRRRRGGGKKTRDCKGGLVGTVFGKRKTPLRAIIGPTENLQGRRYDSEVKKGEWNCLETPVDREGGQQRAVHEGAVQGGGSSVIRLAEGGKSQNVRASLVEREINDWRSSEYMERNESQKWASRVSFGHL